MDPAADEADLELSRYFPYRLAILADAVSVAVAQLYTHRFDLTRQEWRVIAALGERREMAAKSIGEQAALDKMQVSRAVASLLERGLILRQESENDRRNKMLQLTAAGRAIYRKIVPMALAREAYLLNALAPGEAEMLDRVMDRLLVCARDLASRG